MPLSDLQIRKAKPKDKPFRLGDGLGLGLHLMVKPNGSKLWQFRFRYMGKEKLLSLGQYPIVSLADARKKRDDAKRLLEDGADPSVQKKLDRINAQAESANDLQGGCDEYYQGLIECGLAPATQRKKRWQIDDLAKPLHNRPIDQIPSL